MPPGTPSAPTETQGRSRLTKLMAHRVGQRPLHRQASIDFVGASPIWFRIAAVVLLVASPVLGLRGLNPGIEFRGGSEFRVSGVQATEQTIAADLVAEASCGPTEVQASRSSAATAIRVQTERLDDDETDALRDELAEGYGVPGRTITVRRSSVPRGAPTSPGRPCTGLVIFLVLVAS